jgi:hypothetical protein
LRSRTPGKQRTMRGLRRTEKLSRKSQVGRNGKITKTKLRASADTGKKPLDNKQKRQRAEPQLIRKR